MQRKQCHANYSIMSILYLLIILLAVTYASGQRISDRKYAEYSQLDFSSSHLISLLADDTKPLLEISEKCKHNNGYLIGKENYVEIGEYPHMAAIGTISGNARWRCSGSLISERYVLTVAHCVSRRFKPTTVRLGGYNLRNIAAAGSKNMDIPIEKVIIHPKFDKTTLNNDIAIMKLSQDAEFNYEVRPACLYTNTDAPLGKVVNTNYGLFSEDEDCEKILNKISLDVLSIDDPKCETFKRFYNMEDNSLCVDSPKLQSNVVVEDSGSPIQIPSKNDSCVYHLVGVASLKIDRFNNERLSNPSPTLYTKISFYLDWIEENVWGEK